MIAVCPELPGEDARFAVPETVVWRDVPGDLVLFETRTEIYHTLNPGASEIWRALSRGLPVRDTIAGLALHYGGDILEIGADVRAFIRQALDRSLLVEFPNA